MKLIKLSSFQEWLEWRMTGVGSSDAPSIMGVGFNTITECWALKTERAIRKPSNSSMRRGRALEPIARKEYERITGIEIPPANAQSDEYGWMLASLDGINLEEGIVVELKCPGPKDHALAMKGEIPFKYQWQCAHLSIVTGLPVDYASFDGKRIEIVPYKKNLSMEQKLIEKEHEFWSCVLNDTPPKEEVKFSDKPFQEKLKNVLNFRGKK